MRIGIDATCWSNRRGFGRFTRELLEAIAALETSHEFLLFADRQTAEQAEFPSSYEVIIGETNVSPTEAAAADGRRSLHDVWVMRKIVAQEPLDAMFFPAVYSYFPISGRVPCLVTFHDVIAETLPHLVFETRRSRWFWSLKSTLAARRSACILTVSQTSKQGLMKRFGVSESRVRVLTEAPAAAFGPVDIESDAHAEALARYGLPHGTNFLLSVGGISPHKNLDRLIEAFARLAGEPDQQELRLVLVGDYKGDVFRTCYEDLSGLAARLGVGDRVQFSGYVPDAELAHLYAGAIAFVFPSYLEGFGLPAVEAMACGAPVVASTGGSLPEVVGDAGELFEPTDVAMLVDRLGPVIRTPAIRKEMSKKSLRRAKDFSWQRSARQAVAAFEEFGSGSQRTGSTNHAAHALATVPGGASHE